MLSWRGDEARSNRAGAFAFLERSAALGCAALVWAALKWAALVSLAVLGSCWTHVAVAGSVGTRPYGNYEPLRVTYTPDPTEESSSEEMTITISTPLGKPSPVDRELEVVLYVAGYYRASTAYRIRIPLAEGAASATAKLHYRQPHSYASWVVDVVENDRSIAFPKPVSSYVSVNQPNQFSRSCCEITVPGQAAGTGLPIDYAVNNQHLVNIQLQDAPTDWRVYLRFGFVVWSIENLRNATQQQVQALSSYVAAGGVLVVHYVPSDQLGEIDRLLSPVLEEGHVDYRWQPVMDDSKNIGKQRPHAGGLVFCLESAPTNLEKLIQPWELYPVSDFVHESSIDHHWFWRCLVQTVGKTPVWTFSILVILFATLVGPVLLVFTKRLRRRTLMLFLVPSISGVLTVLILLYNVLREGFETRGRVCSVQVFDSHTGQGHVWSRQSFFSGAPPAQGLSFPRNSLLNPVDTSHDTNNMGRPQHLVSAEILDDGQSLYLRNWLAPRSQQQVSVSHTIGANSLPISITSGSGTTVQVTNNSQTELPIVILHGKDNLYYQVSPLAANQTTELSPQTLTDVESVYYKKIRDWVPNPPVEIDTTQSRSSRRTRYWYGNSSRSFAEPLERVLSSRDVIGNLSEYGYLIISRQSSSVETPFPAEVYEKESNLHILTGSNPW